ncbi:MAG: methyltransferase type 11 [Betaproteobacteria bacterium RIFCSPHIGHO2_12_FULL_69_13]|nr:MAG: methyltransferase type 11 [Betaproteobacteria bacterium RIFCSPHIGHO2_12_FULL_69_13]OGA65537.1 MAG: methyltransferase type 11 [Betaproteobacteria bacterium RIFCSPLOWO2_12_FULL_68_20]
MSTATAAKPGLDTADLEQKVKEMYRDVARDPGGEFHFEMGRALAERLGYPPADLDRIPAAAIDSFAGVGYYFHLAQLKEGEAVVDLGSGSGMDSFVAALHVGATGKVLGVDMTEEQLEKSERLRAAAGFASVSYQKGYIERVPRADGTFDAVISNGVINLAPDKQQAFNEAARLLRRGGRLAIADIVTEAQLPDGVTEKADLWAACIGGAMQVDQYLEAIKRAGLRLETIQDNPQYRFISDNAKSAVRKWGVKSVSLLAVKA